MYYQAAAHAPHLTARSLLCSIPVFAIEQRI
jgi:hypothetical protein